MAKPKYSNSSLASGAFGLCLIAGAAFVSSCGSQTHFTGGPNLSPQGKDAHSDAMSNSTVTIEAGAAGKGPAAYGSNPLIVSPGTMVTWVNNDSTAHSATSDSGVWDSNSIAPSGSYSFTFNTPGTFPYHCSIQGAQSMSGMIQVMGPVPTPTTTVSPWPPTPYPTPTKTVNPQPFKPIPKCKDCQPQEQKKPNPRPRPTLYNPNGNNPYPGNNGNQGNSGHGGQGGNTGNGDDGMGSNNSGY